MVSKRWPEVVVVVVVVVVEGGECFTPRRVPGRHRERRLTPGTHLLLDGQGRGCGDWPPFSAPTGVFLATRKTFCAAPRISSKAGRAWVARDFYHFRDYRTRLVL
ncbi:hypothetical protein O3P69_015297 [Scylla paramamosain]|uniref:Secreted protein n=1 Tax=Scylla paramamosain TaxID=85552 RepID=A0AAW0T733_SCYPA